MREFPKKGIPNHGFFGTRWRDRFKIREVAYTVFQEKLTFWLYDSGPIRPFWFQSVRSFAL